jgi:hypothetical protein
VGQSDNGSTGVSANDSSTNYYTDYEGGGQPHNNMPPYITKYCWERIA